MRLTLDTEITAGDEATGDSKHLVGRERDVERLRDGSRVVDEVKDRLVTRFDRHNRRGRGEHRRVGDEVGGSEVRGNADVLDSAGDWRHSGDGRQGTGEVELAT